MPSSRHQSGAPTLNPTIICTNLCLFVEDVEDNLDTEMGLNMLETPLLIAWHLQIVQNGLRKGRIHVPIETQ
jgi:hypothetical protein